MINANKKSRSHRGIPSSEYGDVAGRKNKPGDVDVGFGFEETQA
jgi:hypothetical protein